MREGVEPPTTCADRWLLRLQEQCHALKQVGLSGRIQCCPGFSRLVNSRLSAPGDWVRNNVIGCDGVRWLKRGAAGVSGSLQKPRVPDPGPSNSLTACHPQPCLRPCHIGPPHTSPDHPSATPPATSTLQRGDDTGRR
ncbi:hypothetical protein L209DRAFT_269732 [Thermothelomyces heterothallicus CBS 203.75]